MTTGTEARAVLSDMIISHSGWRGVFAESGGEEDGTAGIGAGHRAVVTAAAAAFAKYLRGRGGGDPVVLLGMDTRPTGRAVVEAAIPALLASGCRVRYAGVVAAPEIMAWARLLGKNGPANLGFIYVSASHNPVGHNGLKFGLADGGTLQAGEAAKLAGGFRSLMSDPDGPGRLAALAAGADRRAAEEILASEPEAKKEAREAYAAFAAEVAWAVRDPGAGGTNPAKSALVKGIEKKPLGVCCDFNGSARCVSIDREFLGGLGIRFEAINDVPGEIAHRIVPEGESLEPCRVLLEELHRRDPAFVMGYVPDCDGDRGNLVIWDDGLQKARALEAQEVFAVACVAELAFLAWDGGPPSRTAVAVNDPTSLRIDRIAGAFGAEVFRAEVGEANVVGLARRLRDEGRTVRILGEGSAGGNITHPSAVRDPLHTVLALARLLSLRTEGDRPGLFEIWCRVSGRADRYRPGFGIADVIASLPPFSTTGAYSPEAILGISETDHGALKRRYQGIFLREWERRRDGLRERYGIYGWEAMAYNGTGGRNCTDDFGKAGRGGLKILFLDAGGGAVASLWMRGSATEPVFRVMADAGVPQAERELIEWQRRMVTEADKGRIQ